MSLIKCPECGNEVSDKATSCPKCAYPISPKPAEIPKPEDKPTVQTIELTSKPFKLQILLSVLAMIGGCIGMVTTAGTDGSSDGPPVFWMVVFFAGCLWLIVTRFLIWWHHE